MMKGTAITRECVNANCAGKGTVFFLKWDRKLPGLSIPVYMHVKLNFHLGTFIFVLLCEM